MLPRCSTSLSLLEETVALDQITNLRDFFPPKLNDGRKATRGTVSIGHPYESTDLEMQRSRQISKSSYVARTMTTHAEEHYDALHAEARKELNAERDVPLAAVVRARDLRRGPAAHR